MESSDVAIEDAHPGDLSAVLELLAGATLPRAGVAQHFDTFLVARSGERLVGAIGLERYGDSGLLRSAVVSPDRRGEGIGRALAAELLKRSAGGGVKRVFLLTETAAPFFGHLGFVPIAREAVDARVRSSVEFTEACPVSAACLWRPIP